MFLLWDSHERDGNRLPSPAPLVTKRCLCLTRPGTELAEGGVCGQLNPTGQLGWIEDSAWHGQPCQPGLEAQALK